MYAPLELTGLTKVFQTPTGPFIAVKDVNVPIHDGECVALLGHEGHGSSTVLAMVAGLVEATLGGVVIDGYEVVDAGPERALVPRSPGLLPWLTVRQNVELAAGGAPRWRAPGTPVPTAMGCLALAGVDDLASRLPAALPPGAAQRVSLARALALGPRFLLLDDAFAELDSLTRFELQDVLLRIRERSGVTVVMVTHDVDEALYLADRLVLMTDGPEATVGDVFTVPFGRPRARAAVLSHPDYHASRRHVIDFLEHHAHQSRPSALDDVLRRRGEKRRA